MHVAMAGAWLALGFGAWAMGCGDSGEESEVTPVAASAPEASPVASSEGDGPPDTTTQPAPQPQKSPFAGAPTADTERALKTLRGVVERWGRDGNDPWVVGHALVAMGPEWRLEDDRLAIDAMVGDHAVVTSAPDGSGRITFPRKRDGKRIEPHTDLFLKVFSEIGLASDRAFEVRGNTYTVKDLWLSALARSYIDGTGGASYASPNDTPWSLQALTTWSEGRDLVWQTDDGHRMSLDFLTDFAMTVLTQETEFLRTARAAGASFEKRGQGIFQYTCGGAHLLQGVGFAVARGYGNEKGAALLAEQVALHFYRLPRELRLYDEALQAYGKTPAYQNATEQQKRDVETRMMVQRLKFLGHWVETSHKFGALGLFAADKDGAMAMVQAVRALVLLVDTMERESVFARLPEIRVSDEQLYLDVLGDAAHAIVALELATGVRTVAR